MNLFRRNERWTATMELRWATDPADTGHGVLQQLWQNGRGESEWRPIPTVVTWEARPWQPLQNVIPIA